MTVETMALPCSECGGEIDYTYTQEACSVYPDSFFQFCSIQCAESNAGTRSGYCSTHYNRGEGCECGPEMVAWQAIMYPTHAEAIERSINNPNYAANAERDAEHPYWTKIADDRGIRY